MKSFKPGKDNTYAISPSFTISCLMSQYDTILIYCPGLILQRLNVVFTFTFNATGFRIIWGKNKIIKFTVPAVPQGISFDTVALVGSYIFEEVCVSYTVAFSITSGLRM